ncbi:unnamed protein product [Vitrella brassicaformis CCMP3155]|uniref:HTH CENPB-type domain-containing protein n=1 Tax=Vitrella brassicaformis (strain CCMP3155) TaxID=1169540 RepID=A0A0G4GYB8_VITBC|nr:unnamed protein product [Vitrella brassicaformis CCMP3155]|eukprot:CEM36121.1 unnamed protein product [Vitrella brassicaformis CCMP3155]
MSTSDNTHPQALGVNFPPDVGPSNDHYDVTEGAHSQVGGGMMAAAPVNEHHDGRHTQAGGGDEMVSFAAAELDRQTGHVAVNVVAGPPTLSLSGHNDEQTSSHVQTCLPPQISIGVPVASPPPPPPPAAAAAAGGHFYYEHDSEPITDIHHAVAQPHPDHASPFPPSPPRTRQRAQSLPPRSLQGEISVGERQQLVDEFDQRKQSGGEPISMPQFAKEKGIPLWKFKQWYYPIKKQREEGKQVADPTKKRNRQPKYAQIEDEIRKWMADHDDPVSIPTKDIKAKAFQIANQLSISGFKASDPWVGDVKRRYQQGQVAGEPDAVQVADGFIGRGSNDATNVYSADAQPAAAVDQQSEQRWQPSEGRNTMSMEASVSGQTGERPPAKIPRSDNRSHRDAPPSVVLSHSYAETAFSITADDHRSDIQEVDDISDLSTCDPSEEDMRQQTEVIPGSSLSASEFATLYSLSVPSIGDVCVFTLLYR